MAAVGLKATWYVLVIINTWRPFRGPTMSIVNKRFAILSINYQPSRKGRKQYYSQLTAI